ncbi:biotin/methionine sulfoxide reductase [Roseovarius pacificus]|uniref:Biotin/methionine sulfoxide reductase n=1 Tax=Roseovarius pacificus TaxID=337701 RepID=A0A1M7A0F9_9RHOB|nr:molybdopterin guanine dinucleotide-containing S/N-oxide reductase [Roseovarius pacificus]GGO54030.1 dimethylsulfoxide reductase [Roseovarius pacificus]SHL36194.1 biotin/methionine sulfoxide reductase [Roseovarius pacificus]
MTKVTHRDRDIFTTAHWGTYRVDVQDGRVIALRDFEHDPDPSPIGHGIVGVLDGPTRITRPMVRKGWLEHGPGATSERRGEDAFIPVTWDRINDIVAQELRRIREQHGNGAIFAGSYGWASAGRFHHAQGQLKRFLNLNGGFVRSVNSYSYAAAEVTVPHVIGDFTQLVQDTTSWASVAQNAELFVAFGGVPLKNGQINQGGTGRHVQRAGLRAAHANGVQFVNVSPLKSDLLEETGADWIAPRPSSDTALMLALCHTLLAENLHDRAFLDRYCHGFDRFAAYLTGETDGQAKTADWAADLCDLPADTIRALARRMAGQRTMISIAWALTRQDHGEMAYWAAISLAAMLGQIGLPGTGIGFGYSAENFIGASLSWPRMAAFPQGRNPVADFIPVARISDMLENPGGAYDFNGQRRTYPDIRMIWWAGGNPFHHHQDLNRFRRALPQCETFIVNEWCWNATAKHADIVLPCTTTLERRDLGLTPRDTYQVVMDQAIAPVGEAKSDHDIFRGIAARLGCEEAFTEGRTPDDWQRHLYDVTRQQVAASGIALPGWEEFQSKGWAELPPPETEPVLLSAFRADPEAHPLDTPSGRIELFSETVAGFGYDDAPGHAAWTAPVEWLGSARPGELHMISNQPRTKLHSQLDHGSVSQSDRIRGRVPLTMHPTDAAARDLSEGDIVRVFNDRGAFLAGLCLSETLRPGVIQIATGAWFDPLDGQCRVGNPNAVTRDAGTSRLAQGPTAHSCLVRVEAHTGPLPEVTAYAPPEILENT